MARRCQRLFSLGSWRSLLSTCFHFKFSARVCIVPVCSLLCIMQSENLEACSDKSGEVLDLEIYSMKSNTQIKVEGDGRLVHVTDEEVFEVEDLPDDGKSARILADTGRDVKCTPNNNCSLGIMQSENLEACSYKSGEVLGLVINSPKSNTQIKVRQVKAELNITCICSRYYRASELIFGAT